MCSMLEKYKIKEVHGRAYHPQSQGCVENVNETVLVALTKYIEDITRTNIRWVYSVKSIVATKNNTIHHSTGFTPFEAFRGFKCPAILLSVDKEAAAQFQKPPQEEIERNLKDIQVSNVFFNFNTISILKFIEFQNVFQLILSLLSMW